MNDVREWLKGRGMSAGSFGEYMRRVRESRGLRQDDVEAASDGQLSQNYISGVETGKNQRPSYEKLAVFARVYKVHVNVLLRRLYGVPDEDDRGEYELSDVDRDLLMFADERPDLKEALERVRDANTLDDWDVVKRIIHRSLISGAESALDAVGRHQPK